MVLLNLECIVSCHFIGVKGEVFLKMCKKLSYYKALIQKGEFYQMFICNIRVKFTCGN